MRKIISLSAMALLLAGCGIGWPWSHGGDPNIAATLQGFEPLVAQCRQEFQRTQGDSRDAPISGPSITRVGGTTTIRLTAQSARPDAIDPASFTCEFDQDKLISADFKR